MTTLVKCKVHPVVLFSIINAYERRQEEDQSVVGILLGIQEKELVDITNCFPILIKKRKDETYIETDLASSMYENHKKGNPNENMVGWFSTSPVINSQTFDIHSQCSKLNPNPILLTLDTTIKNNKFDCKAYINLNMGVPDKSFGSMFMPIDVTLVNFETEKIAVDSLIRDEKRLLDAVVSQASSVMSSSGEADFINLLPSKTSFILNPSDLGRLCAVIDEMIEKLKLVIKYTESQVNHLATANTNQKQQPSGTNANTAITNNVTLLGAGGLTDSSSIGRKLKELVSCIPSLDKLQFEELFKGNVKDMMMVIYILKLLQCQVNIQSKLNML